MITTSTSELPQNTMPHVLYSRGSLLKHVDHDEAVEALALATRKDAEQVESRLLSGKPKKIKSSDSLVKLCRLKQKLEDCGLDVYIKLERDE